MPCSIWDISTTQKQYVPPGTRRAGRYWASSLPAVIACSLTAGILFGVVPLLCIAVPVAALGIVFRNYRLITLSLISVLLVQLTAGNSPSDRRPEISVTGIPVQFSGVIYRDSRLVSGGAVHFLSLERVRTLRGNEGAARGKLCIFTSAKILYSWGAKASFTPGTPFSDLSAVLESVILNADPVPGKYSLNRWFSFRETGRSLLNRRLAQLTPQAAALLQALITGYRPRLIGSLGELFRQIGASHLLALSGMHLAVLVSIGIWLLRYVVSIPRARLCILIILPLYLFIVGPQPSLLRAAVMLLLYYGTAKSRRRPGLGSLLIYSYIILLFMQPGYLYDPGFCFSYAALYGILYAGPLIIRLLCRILPFQISSPLGASIAAWAGTLPLTLMWFGINSPGGILAAIVITPLVWLFLAGGLIFILLPPFFPVSQLFRTVYFYLYQWIENTAKVFTLIPRFTAGPILSGIIAGFTVLAFFASFIYSCPRRFYVKNHKPAGALTDEPGILELETGNITAAGRKRSYPEKTVRPELPSRCAPQGTDCFRS